MHKIDRAAVLYVAGAKKGIVAGFVRTFPWHEEVGGYPSSCSYANVVSHSGLHGEGGSGEDRGQVQLLPARPSRALFNAQPRICMPLKMQKSHTPFHGEDASPKSLATQQVLRNGETEYIAQTMKITPWKELTYS
jgi:hypothetical protein